MPYCLHQTNTCEHMPNRTGKYRYAERREHGTRSGAPACRSTIAIDIPLISNYIPHHLDNATDESCLESTGREGRVGDADCARECACVDDNESSRGGFNTSAMKLHKNMAQKLARNNKWSKRCQSTRTRQSGWSSDRQRATPRRLRVAHTRATTATPGRWRTRVC